MRCFMVLCFSLFLFSCGGVSSTTTLSNNAQKTLDALKTSLTTDCKTEIVNANLESLQAQINTIAENCETRLVVEKQKVTNRNLLIVVLGMIIAFLFKKRLF